MWAYIRDPRYVRDDVTSTTKEVLVLYHQVLIFTNDVTSLDMLSKF